MLACGPLTVRVRVMVRFRYEVRMRVMARVRVKVRSRLRYHLEPKLKKRTHLKKALIEAGIDPNSIADCEFEEPRELSRPRSRRCA
eukprot:489250-Amorphochlora_amoeboformis.AAC.1